MKFITRCSQRGCAGEVDGDASPVFCPVCNQPLLDGDVTEVQDAPPDDNAPTDKE